MGDWVKLKPIKHLRKLGRRLLNLLGRPARRRLPLKPAALEALRREYRDRGLDRLPDSFALIRVVGNDLPPRHALGQMRANLQFILEHEPKLPDCETMWIVNRIVDPAEEAAIIALLERHGQSYQRLPFSFEDYARIPWDLDGPPWRGGLLSRQARSLLTHTLAPQLRVRLSKNNYVMNNNGARNAALELGRGRAKWVLPWDGNCFLTERAWTELRDAVLAQPHLKYFIVPMARIRSNLDVLQPGFRPTASDEPQVLFRRDAGETFDLAYAYGRRPKVELFWRLGVPGPWDSWQAQSWDPPKPALSPEAGQFGFAGWVARLESGNQRMEDGDRAYRKRGRARSEAIVAMLDALDCKVIAARLDPERLACYRESSLVKLAAAKPGDALHPLALQIAADAQAALARGLHAVTDKTGRAPSGDSHDYWHPAPFWWPDPARPDGLPYIRRDGERRPGSTLYAPGSEAFDRSRLQRVLEDSAICALAWRVTGEAAFATHGAALIRRWFLAPETRMNPHLRYAQVRLGSNGNVGHAAGIVEMRDLVLALDAARLLARHGAFTPADQAAFRAWLEAYAGWLLASPQGGEALIARHNVGTHHELQLAAIAAYLGDAAALNESLRRCRERIQLQFEPDGSQPNELDRAQTLHYCVFNLQAWVALARVAASCGDDLWSYRSAAGHSLRQGFAWLLGFAAERAWPYRQDDAFDWTRLAPLQDALARADGAGGALPEAGARFPAETGIPPYWFL